MKVQGVFQKANTSRKVPDHDFLKYWRVIRFWVKKKIRSWHSGLRNAIVFI